MSSDIFSLKKSIFIFKKELRFFFFSPIAYIFSTIFLVVSGIYFFSRFFLVDQNSMEAYFIALPLILSFTIPPITMSLFSSEFQNGSYELISTQPVTTLEIILGKFFASSAFVLFALMPTLLYPVTLSFIGRIDLGTVLAGYIGAIFLVISMCSIGIFASSLTKNQIVSLVVSLLIMILLNFFLRFLGVIFPMTMNIIDFISSDTHFLNMAIGIIDLRDILYFVSLTVIFLYATFIVIENRR